MTILKNVRLNGTVNFTPSPVFADLQVYYDAGKTASYPGSGTTWFDISGNGKNASLTATTYSPDLGGAIVFADASGSRGQSASTIPWNTNAYTISTWLFPTTVDSNIRRFVSMQGPTPNFFNWAVTRLDGVNGAGQFHTFSQYAAGLSFERRSNAQVVNNTYQNFVSTYNGTTLTIYKNNSFLGSTTFAQQLPYGATVNTLILSNATETFDGRMYVVMIYDRVLTTQERTQNYDAFRGRFGL